MPKPLPWAERNQVVFLGGHVPKLYLMPLRYLIWQQLYSNPRAWTQSFGINCTVGAYEICDHPDLRKPRGAPATHPEKHVYHTFCNDACARPPDASHVHTATRSKAINARGKEYKDSEGNVVGDQPSCLGTWRQTTQHAAAKLRDDCLRYRVVDYKAEAAAQLAASAVGAGMMGSLGEKENVYNVYSNSGGLIFQAKEESEYCGLDGRALGFARRRQTRIVHQ